MPDVLFVLGAGAARALADLCFGKLPHHVAVARHVLSVVEGKVTSNVVP